MASVIITPVTPIKQKALRPGSAALAKNLADIPSPSPPRRQAVTGPSSARPASSLGRKPPATRFEKEMARDGGQDPEADKDPKVCLDEPPCRTKHRLIPTSCLFCLFQFMGPWRFGKTIGKGAAGLCPPKTPLHTLNPSDQTIHLLQVEFASLNMPKTIVRLRSRSCPSSFSETPRSLGCQLWTERTRSSSNTPKGSSERSPL